MTRGNARELAIHLIYSQSFTDEEPDVVVAARLEKEYYKNLSAENDVYEERPSRAQIAYIDNVVAGVTNRRDELNEQIQKFSIGWDVSRISRLARTVMQLEYEGGTTAQLMSGIDVNGSSSMTVPYSAANTPP